MKLLWIRPWVIDQPMGNFVMQLTLAAQQIIDDAVEDLNDFLKLFKDNPSVKTLDDVYRATRAIETARLDQLEK